MQHLVADPNSRIRLIAASSLLFAEPGNTKAGAVLVEALADPPLRVREAALVLLETLGPKGAAFLEVVNSDGERETEPEIAGVP